jgi:hypothetical protein
VKRNRRAHLKPRRSRSTFFWGVWQIVKGPKVTHLGWQRVRVTKGGYWKRPTGERVRDPNPSTFTDGDSVRVIARYEVPVR